MPEGSKIVKIGWSVKKMASFPTALEADEVQRVEYMVKDSKVFNSNGITGVMLDLSKKMASSRLGTTV